MTVPWHMRGFRKLLLEHPLKKSRLIVASRGKYGQDYFTLRSTYLEGRTPKSVNMYWRRFAVSEIPLDDPKEFDEWLLERWREKDSLMEEYMTSGRFPGLKVSEVDGMKTTVSSENGEGRYIETEIKAEHWWEFGKIFVLLATFGLVTSILGRIYNMTLHGNDSDLKHLQAPVAY
jgi:lysocardiolipin and lysophospholipid acyltransferase